MCVQQPLGFKQHDGSMSTRGLEWLFPFLPFEGTEGRAGLATTLRLDGVGAPVEVHQFGGFSGSGIFKRASLQATGFKGRSLWFRASRSACGRFVWRRNDEAFWQGTTFLPILRQGISIPRGAQGAGFLSPPLPSAPGAPALPAKPQRHVAGCKGSHRCLPGAQREPSTVWMCWSLVPVSSWSVSSVRHWARGKAASSWP